MKSSMAVIIPFAGSFTSALRPILARLTQASLFALLAAGAAQAQSHFEEDFDNLDKPWQEIAIQLPALPKNENLLEFDVGETATMRFFVDAKSISTGDDGVVRYTLVSRSPSGAENISYEGLRCETQERKLYAFGHKDGSWSRSRRDRWERYLGSVANSQHAALARDYFCTHKVVEGNAEQIMRRLRDKRSLMHGLTR
jgi:hypothetical protein